MRGCLLVLAMVIAGWGGGASAADDGETFPLGLRHRIATVTLPRDWEIDDVDRGWSADTPQDEIYLWVEAYRPPDRDRVMAEHRDYVVKQGGATLSDPPASTTRMVNGHPAEVVTLSGSWNDAPTLLRHVLIPLGQLDGQEVMVTYWVSPDDETRFAPALTRILDSVVPAPVEPARAAVDEYFLRDTSGSFEALKCLSVEKRRDGTYVEYYGYWRIGDEFLIIEPTRARATPKGQLAIAFTDNFQNRGRATITLTDGSATVDLEVVKPSPDPGGRNVLRQYSEATLARRPCLEPP